VGPDGSGKSAVAKRLLETCPFPVRYLYMGASIESSNVALPTSRLIHRWKVRRHRRALQAAGKPVPERIEFHGMEHRDQPDSRGRLGATVRLCHRLAEETYRQVVSWACQLRGFVVLYDRHFLFDLCPVSPVRPRPRATERLHHWFLRQVYPRPGLVVFLDAPPDILYARKQEVTRAYLEADRASLLAKAEFAPCFVRVDATQELDQVVAVVRDLMIRHCAPLFSKERKPGKRTS
jgi:thymidylate kinase